MRNGDDIGMIWHGMEMGSLSFTTENYLHEARVLHSLHEAIRRRVIE